MVANGQSLFLFVDPIEEIALFYVRSVAYYHPRHPTLCNTSRGISHEITVDAAQCFMHFKHFNKANKSDLFKKTYCCSLDGSMAEGGCDAKTRFMMACLAADAAVAVVTPTGVGW